MIPITFSWFMVLYLGLFLAGVILLWLGYEWTCRREARKRERTRMFCRICGSRYTDTSGYEVVECPACGSLNERTI